MSGWHTACTSWPALRPARSVSLPPPPQSMPRCIENLALLLVAAAVTPAAVAQDACATKLQQLCGYDKQEGMHQCEVCLQSKYRELGFACYGKQAEIEAFCKVPDCDSTLADVCGSVRGTGASCSACAGAHQDDLQKMKCTQQSIEGFCSAGINPIYKQNITVYHVNPESYGLQPINMNTGDAVRMTSTGAAAVSAAACRSAAGMAVTM
eukprot:COSAG01_NODE_1384_length_10514_cov_17.435046_8_plen_209_part_00